VPPTSTAPASAEPIALSFDDVGNPLSGGRYSIGVGEGARHQGVELDLPAGWISPLITPNQAAFQPGAQEYFPYVGFFSVRRVYADPCHPEDGVAATSSGPPTAEELIEQLRNLPGFAVADDLPRSIGGLEATHFTISNAVDTAAAACTDDPWLNLFITWDGSIEEELNQRSEAGSARTISGTAQDLWILARGANDPQPLLVVTETGTAEDEETPARLDTIQQILSSIRFS
jgi:hypothetical protein